MKYIAVIGASVCDKETGQTAYEVGKEIANSGHVLICGGLTGVMELAAKGASETGGLTIGILPGVSKKEANPYIKIPIATGLGEARNAVIVRTADVLIAVGGEFGTLSEIALGLKMGKKVIGIGTWCLFKDETESLVIQKADSAKQAVSLAIG
jgi:uncharacterized protein (TIGR00725 family)